MRPRLQLAQVEVGPTEGDHPRGVARPLNHGRHILVLVLTTGSLFHIPDVFDVHLGEPHGGARIGARHPAHDVEAVPGLVHHLAAAQNSRPNCEKINKLRGKLHTISWQ